MLAKLESHSLPYIPFGRSEALNGPDEGKLSDRMLWEAFKNGDELAFINIYKNYVNILINYGCQFSDDREMVKDCLQDFFLYLRKNRAGFGKTDSIKMYLFKAFRRRVLDYLKKYNRESNLNQTFAFFQFPIELSSESIYINRQIETEQLKRLNEALKALDRKEREAIYYFYFEKLSYEHIAEIFSFSHVSSARRVVYRGLSQLRKFFSIISVLLMIHLLTL